LKRCKTFTIEIRGGVFTGARTRTHFLVKDENPIPIQLLRKTKVSVGRPKAHPISGQAITYGQVPYGFERVGGILQPDPMQQFVLKRIHELRENGASLSEIARQLVDSAIPTRNGGTWQPNTIRKILSR